MKKQERAAQIWSVLALAARNRQILTYEIVYQLVGIPPQGQAETLDHIQQYCLQNNLPPLTILVVNKETGLPGKGFTAVEDIPGNQVRVFEYNWLEHGAPSPEELSAAYQAAQSG